jgi:hypothetical protein
VSDLRTRQYTGGVVPTRPLAIAVGDSACTAAGRAALLAAANATVRNHPTVYVCAPDVGRVHAELDEIGRATPTSKLEIVERIPAGVPTIGIGDDVTANLFIAARRFTGGVSGAAATLSDEPSTIYGAGLGAMLAAAVMFRRDIGLVVPTFPLMSLWTFAVANGGTGPADVGPIDIGVGWVVGAGGVGSSFAWWLQLFGTTSTWLFIDHDFVEASNLNRSLGMFVRHLDRGDGKPWRKCAAAAQLVPGATPFHGTWSDWTAADASAPDVLVPAANDFGVRAALGTYGHPMALTGTTSLDWTAELHLYRASLDGCVGCRHSEHVAPSFACSSASVPTRDGGSTDAALSFLSGTAGLLTLSTLARLQAGELRGDLNHWTIAFGPSRRPLDADSYHCRGGTPHSPAPAVAMNQFGMTRWHRA